MLLLFLCIIIIVVKAVVVEDGDEVFKCDQTTISATRVNDDYCDCKDGTDETETSACSNVAYFSCTDTRIVREISTSKLGDGICDCCDGSDETFSNKCKNTCDHELYQYRKEMRQEAETHEKGATNSQDIRPPGKQQDAFIDYKQRGKQQYAQDLKTKEAELTQVRGYIQQTIQQIKSSGKEIDPTNPTAGVDPRALQFYQSVHRHIAAVKYHSDKLEKLDEKDLGYRLQYFPLLSECFRSPIINEKRLKGGTPNVIPQLYQFEFCPYKHVTQFEINHTLWDVNEKLAKHGRELVQELPQETLDTLGIGKPIEVRTPQEGQRQRQKAEKGTIQQLEVGSNGGVVGRVLSFFGFGRTNEEIVQDDSVTKPGSLKESGKESRTESDKRPTVAPVIKINEEGTSTLVGVYSGWNNSKAGTNGGEGSDGLMTFSEGQPCQEGIGLNGPTKRSIRVWFTCGVSNRVIKVEENGYCTYDMYFETMHACSFRESRRLRAELTTLKRSSKEPKININKKKKKKKKSKKKRIKRNFNE